MGLRTAQLEAYPSGNFNEPTPEDDRFWAAAVELGMPINVHQQFFFPVGDLGSVVNADGVPGRDKRAKALGLDIAAGEFQVILSKLITTRRLRAFPGPQVHRDRELRRLGSVLSGAFRRVRPSEPASLDASDAAE